MFFPPTRCFWAAACCLLTLLITILPADADDTDPPALNTGAAPAVAFGHDAAPEKEADSSPFEELLLEARVNGVTQVVTLLALRGPDGRLWLPADNFVYWDMHPPARPIMAYQGRSYHTLEEQAGLSYRIDPTLLTLEIEATPNWFMQNTVDSEINAQTLQPAVSPGGFLNYDLNITSGEANTYAAGLFDAGLFGDWGVATAGFLVRDEQPNEERGVVRLETTWTRDLPERRASLRLGDAISSGSAWGRPVRFGGVQWASNFATQPGFITFPLPSIEGEAALPSTLELYVNGMQRMQSEVPTGPFSIPDLPVVSGQGELQLVVRDMLGRELLITDSFYVSNRLLREGLQEFSYELGAERENFGRESNDYGRTFAVGTHRAGLSDRFTGELRAELLSGQYTAGIGGALLVGRLGVIHGALAGSHSERGEGGQVTAGFEHSSRRLGFGFNLQMASEEFVQLGLQEDKLAPRSLGQAWVSVPLQAAGSVSLSYVDRDERDEPRFKAFTASYQVSLGRIGYLSVFATRLSGDDEDTLFGLSLSRSLGNRTTSSANGNFSRDSDQLLLQVQRNLPVGTGVGYRARVGLLDQERLDAGFSAQNEIGTLHVDVSHADGNTGVRAGAIGGLTWLDDSLHLNRRMDESFAVVRVGDFEGVKIYADNQHVATTNQNGRALLPRLRPYEKNPLRIAIDDLPIEARVDQIEYQAVPYFRSGLVVNFDVTRSRNAIFRLIRSSGEPVPAGSMITTPKGDRFPIGYDGEAFVSDVESGVTLSADWNGTRCVFQLFLPATDEPLPDLGTMSCQEIQR